MNTSLRTAAIGTGRAALAASVAATLAAGFLAGQPAQAGAQAAAAKKADTSWLPDTPVNWPLVVDYDKGPTSTITRGVRHYAETYDTVGGRQRANVLDVDLTDPNVRIGVVEAGDKLTNPADETVTSMAERTHAVAGVNGDYFEIHQSGRPLGGVITDGKLLKSPRPSYNAQLGVRADGSIVLGPQSFSGSITDGAAAHPLTSVNVVNDLATGGITEVNSYLGAAEVPAATLVLGRPSAGNRFVVQSVQTDVTTVPQLTADQVGLVGAGEGGAWLAKNIHTGDKVSLSHAVAPNNNLQQLVSGAAMLVRDGKVFNDPTGTPPGGVNPETMVGLTRDGEHAIIATIDGHGGATEAFGVSPEQAAGYMIAHGAYTAVLFDGGGSTEMVSRKPGDQHVSVTNVPSDAGNVERPVANGIFLYSTAKQAGAATTAVVNGGQPVTTVAGGTVPTPIYATDALGNPARGDIDVRVEPKSLATWANGKLTSLRSGTGQLIASNGRASAIETLRVVEKLGSLTVSPDTVDLNNSDTRQLTLNGTTTKGDKVTIPAEAATWSIAPAELGAVDAHGLFTAASSGDGMATVTAKVAGATATVSVAVGSSSKTIDDMDSTSTWRLSNNTTGQPATLTTDGDLPPGSTAANSLKLTYTMPMGSGVKQLVLSSSKTLKTEQDADGRDPSAIGLWVKGNATGIQLAESYLSANGTRTTLYPTYVTWNGWQLVVAQLPAGMQFPLTINFVDFLAVSPSTTTSGELSVSGLQALYPARPVTVPTYTPVPDNPSWLTYKEDSATFSTGGDTMLVGDDAHLVASDPGSASSHGLDAIKDRLPTLAPEARPDQVQMLGDMPDDGKLADLQFVKQKLDALGVAETRDVVGNHEITQGADAENVNFAQVFGDTHYAYPAGPAQVIVTDNAHGSLLTSDPFQVPAEAQYPWLVDQLSKTTAKAVVVITHMPAYDPHPAANSQFTDRWEARMYLRLMQKYQQSHQGKHLVMLYGHARGFSEQILNPLGESVSVAEGGIPQFAFADLGMPAYAPSEQGGFYNFGLFHITAKGDFEFSVEPLLASIAVTAPATTLSTGATATLSAVGTQIGGDNLPDVTMPIADPASHVWSSDNPKIVKVDAVTGKVTAGRPGTATVSVTSGGVTGKVTLTVVK
ncbi:phosphodiester glycosidase family protein [Micromonospora musae]|uniref:phosphodiester glycosidase family protein n=1 Tax=Micromonospora musae TaxID=1894970 RepID=UPI0033F8AFD6